MDTKMLIEALGYLGSLLVVVSMLMTSVMKLRIINTIGSLIFATYAMIIQSYPTAITNFILVLINLYNMRKLMKNSGQYQLIEGSVDDMMTRFFLKTHGADIRTYFSDFTQPEADQKAYVTMCGEAPAGLMIGRETGDGTLEFTLDYTTPTYRDCSAGKFLYDTFRKQGLKELIYRGPGGNHSGYLKKMGFVGQDGAYRKRL